MLRLTPIFGIVMIGAALSWSASHTPAHAAEFSNPQKVTIRGYGGDAMEPFVTRDGRYLFFQQKGVQRTEDLITRLGNTKGKTARDAVKGEIKTETDLLKGHSRDIEKKPTKKNRDDQWGGGDPL